MSGSRRNRVRSQQVGESSGSKGDGDFSVFATPITMASYNDPNYNTWYGTKREFRNEPISMNDVWRTHCGHVIPTNAYDYLPYGVTITNYDLQWCKLYDKRCNLEIYCRWHGLSVPKARSAEICTDLTRDDPAVIERLKLENAQMKRRLKRFHLLEYVKEEAVNVVETMATVIEDPDLMSDPEISDFSDDGDDELPKYLPNCLCRRGKSICCHKYAQYDY